MAFEATEEAVQVLNSSVSQLKWRLRSPARRRLEIDVLALLTEMRPVIMVDYGGKMPELQERLCALIELCQKFIIFTLASEAVFLTSFIPDYHCQESAVFQCLRVMVVDDMIYLIHIKGLAEYAMMSLNSEVEFVFVNLERDPPEMVSQNQNCSLGAEFLRLMKIFSLLSSHDEVEDDAEAVANGKPSTSTNASTSFSAGLVDLSSCMQGTQITVPTLNGWLLGYPVVYLFGKEFIAEAICNLSTKYLRLFRILVRRGNAAAGKEPQPEELMRGEEKRIEKGVKMSGPISQDWEPVVIRKKAPTAALKKDEKVVNAARRAGAEIESIKKSNAGVNKAASSSTSLNTRKLDEETEIVAHERVPSELKKAIMQGRMDKKLTQSQLAQLINEKPQIIQEYESGKAIPNQQIIGKLERALGVKLRGKK
ncbi:Multiprotein-bridging factor 1b [Linum grandiflorum]